MQQPDTSEVGPIEINTEKQEAVADTKEVVETLQHPKQPTKLELKRMQQFQDRLRRLMNKGLTEAQAKEAIAKEDWDNLSPAKKIARLQHFTVMMTSGLRYDITALQDNDGELADAMDINFKAFAKILAKLGVSFEEQAGAIAEAQAEIQADKEKKAREEKAKEKGQKDASEVEAIKAEAKEQEASGETSVPEGATEFGG